MTRVLTPEDVADFYTRMYEEMYEKAVSLAERDFTRANPNRSAVERIIVSDADVKFHIGGMLGLVGVFMFDAGTEPEEPQ